MIISDAVVAFFTCVGVLATVYIIAIPFCRRKVKVALFLKKESVWVEFIRALFGDVLIFYGEDYGGRADKN